MDLFSVLSSVRTRGIGTNWNTGSSIETVENFLTVRVTEQWHMVPREVVESPSLDIFKAVRTLFVIV